MVYGEQIENIIKEMEADRPVPLGLTKAALTLMPSLKKKDGLFIPPEPNVLRSAQYTMPQNIDASEQNTMPRHPHDHYIMVMRMSTIIFAFSFWDRIHPEMDHWDVFLHQGILRSEMPGLIEQVIHDTARASMQALILERSIPVCSARKPSAVRYPPRRSGGPMPARCERGSKGVKAGVL